MVDDRTPADERTPAQEQALIDFEMRLSRSALRALRYVSAVGRADDGIRATKARRTPQLRHRQG